MLRICYAHATHTLRIRISGFSLLVSHGMLGYEELTPTTSVESTVYIGLNSNKTPNNTHGSICCAKGCLAVTAGRGVGYTASPADAVTATILYTSIAK